MSETRDRVTPHPDRLIQMSECPTSLQCSHHEKSKYILPPTRLAVPGMYCSSPCFSQARPLTAPAAHCWRSNSKDRQTEIPPATLGKRPNQQKARQGDLRSAVSKPGGSFLQCSNSPNDSRKSLEYTILVFILPWRIHRADPVKDMGVQMYTR